MEAIVANVLKNQSENLCRERITTSKKKKVSLSSKSDRNDVWAKEEEQKLPSVEDLIKLRPLTDKNVLRCLEARYLTDNICSKAGITIIVVNPFKSIPGMYEPVQIKKYYEGNCKALPPHIFATTDNAYSAMKLGLGQVNQSIIVSGESGAGKTWTTRCLMKYLTSLAEYNPSGFSPSPVHCIEKRILDSNPILEAFGNATTQRNHNSSRFGKYIKLQLDRSGFIIGASIQTYLLEKTRVVHQGPKEKNFHIFYQMLQSASDEERTSWGLPLHDSTQQKIFNFLPRVEVSTVESSLSNTREALKSVGINSKQEDKIFKILSAILHLGNISFTQEEDDDACDMDESASVQESLRMSCSLFGIEEEAFSKYLLMRRIAAHHGNRKSVFMKPCERAEACNRRDCVAKLVYSRLFDWLVSFLNKHTTAKHSYAFIGLLDIYGFESFSFNSLEQLCINYANEKLQQHFVSHFLKAEQDEYRNEELTWDFCQFTDNQPCLDAIEGKISVFSLLNEACKLNRSSDPSALRERILSSISNPFVSKKLKGSKQSSGFVVRHFADEVEYTVDGLTEKNKDYIPPELTEILASSKNLFVRTLIQEDIIAQKKSRSSNAKVPVKTVISKFKNSLDELMVTLRNTTPHYIRCIKPNQQCTPGVFNATFVASQLSACGVIATLAISRSGYPYNYNPMQIAACKGFRIESFKVDMDSSYQNCKLPPKESCQALLEKMCGLDDKENELPGQRSPYKIGRSKVFLQDEQLAKLEREREQVLINKAVCIQRNWRRLMRLKIDRERHMAAVTIQAGGDDKVYFALPS
ncbi:putative unconventional myosin-XIX-like [Apostichopus japonicus]|uniref:Putative unconventional myosin-XIX-like n=1 Tax=Stichopus japonicus TaxID=307972 RepID=A0A2G8L0E2_STIJA|nr:putative unconventional myosin-XIX-like [Apostichopus japonicus]